MKLLRGLALLSVAAGFSLAVLAACGGGDEPSPTPVPTEASTPTATATSTASPTATPEPFNGAVTQLRIPKFDVASAIEEIGLLPTNQLDVPHNPHNTGWYYIYDRPGWGGNALFSAHVDYYPNIKGPFNRLDEMVEGDEVIVQMENGVEYTYSVMSNTRYHVDEIPMGDLIDAEEKPEGEEWITLITCGGEFVPNNGVSGPGRYLHRDVVIARRIA